MDLQDLTERPKTRWVPLFGHLAGIELLIRFATPQESQKFANKLRRAGITRAKAEHPFDVADGREEDFFREFAQMYVLDWRGDIKPEGTAYSAETMGKVLGAYRRALDRVVEVITDEDAFFENGASA